MFVSNTVAVTGSNNSMAAVTGVPDPRDPFTAVTSRSPIANPNTSPTGKPAGATPGETVM